MALTPVKISGYSEFLPSVRLIEEDILDTIRKWYRLAGFTPIETPSVERSETLLAKGVDNEVYGIHRLKAEEGAEDENDLALHFDLTVPMARYVAQHFNELSFPFRRSQIQKVWRGERPQKYRYREFTQADIDIIGDGELPLFADAEILFVINGILGDLNLGEYRMRVNNTKILRGMAEAFGVSSADATDFITLVDKRDKIGIDEVARLVEERFGTTVATSTKSFLSVAAERNMVAMEAFISEHGNDLARLGWSELSEVHSLAVSLGVNPEVLDVDIGLARGLTYYTGTVYESFLIHSGGKKLSFCSGGRYDNLASAFIDRKLPGVGISIGITRLINMLLDDGLITPEAATPTRILVTVMDSSLLAYSLALTKRLREAEIATEVWADSSVRLGKQIAYADKKGIPFVAILGSDEVASGMVQIKNLTSGESVMVPMEDAITSWSVFSALQGKSRFGG